MQKSNAAQLLKREEKKANQETQDAALIKKKTKKISKAKTEGVAPEEKGWRQKEERKKESKQITK
jgi:hypothetical protein